ncbi:MAG: aldolase/citrate lyase family protein [Pseudomonadota bacterium]|nr:aldolase/citrate lyase family protein [Pseudomonadota bacterium]
MDLRPNRIKRKLMAGEIAVAVSGPTHPDDIDAFGPIGVDGIWLEGEHGGVDAAEIGNLTRACDIWGMTSVARINANDQGLIYRTLDRGAQAVVVPHVNTREEAENVVAGGRFPPIGQRGFFPSRQAYGVPDFYKKANNETLLVILIEDIVAWENLDEILSVEGIDVFFVAPGDFAASMGHILAVDHPEVQAKLDDALSRIIAAGRFAGTLATNDSVEHYAKLGVQFFYTVTQPWLDAGAKDFMTRGRDAHHQSN